jgi:hypothetical protein
MRRLIQFATFLALVGFIVMALVCGSRAQNPAAVPAGGTGVPGAIAAQPTNATTPMLTFSGSAALSLSPQLLAGQSAAQPELQPFVRILTDKMALSPESPSVIDASGSDQSAAVAKINAALATVTEIDCTDMKFSEILEILEKRHKIKIQLDSAALKDGGFDENVEITKNLSGISLRSALRLLLDDLKLNYVIHNEVLLITTPEKAESEEYVVTRIYPVKDLVLVRNENGEIETDFGQLTELIINSTPFAKGCLGYNGTIAPYQFRNHCLLVITHTEDVHERIAALLAALRRSGAAGPKDGNELQLPKRARAATSPTTK